MSTVIAEQSRTGLTLAQLRELLARAEYAEIPAEAVPRVRVTLSGKIKRLEVADGS